MRLEVITEGKASDHRVIVPAAPLVAIVDDDIGVREALESLLKSAGFNAGAFASAEEFLESGDLDESSCLILDVRMPGISGFDLQGRLAAAGKRIPIIFITAHADENSRARASSAVAFLPKPFAEEALLEAVRAATRSSKVDRSGSS